MKNILAIILILTLAGVSGCETLKNAFCSPTAEQIMVAGERLALASDTLNYLEGLSPSPEVSASIAGLKIAMPILRQIKDGICVSVEEEANANVVLNSTYTYAAKLGFKGK